jgi:broad specificity phosphatase PhoE
MRHLVFIRHGESALNALSRTTRTYCGQVETPLTEVGRQQAVDAGKKLAQLGYVEPKSAISSPLTRAVETLSLIAGQLAAPVSILPPSPSLMERSHGKFEGVAEEVIFRDYPHYRDHPDYCQFMNHFGQSAPGGETLQIVSDRAWSAIHELTVSTTGDLVIVSHFNPIRCVIGRALNMSQAETLRLHIPNAQAIVLGFNGSFRLVEGPELAPPGGG